MEAANSIHQQKTQFPSLIHHYLLNAAAPASCPGTRLFAVWLMEFSLGFVPQMAHCSGRGISRTAFLPVPRAQFGFPSLSEESAITSPSILVPCISDEIVVCCNHASPLLYGLSLKNGEILLEIFTAGVGAGDVGEIRTSTSPGFVASK